MLTREQIKGVFITAGFEPKDGGDLQPYVYQAAYALLERVCSAGFEKTGLIDAIDAFGRTQSLLAVGAHLKNIRPDGAEIETWREQRADIVQRIASIALQRDEQARRLADMASELAARAGELSQARAERDHHGAHAMQMLEEGRRARSSETVMHEVVQHLRGQVTQVQAEAAGLRAAREIERSTAAGIIGDMQRDIDACRSGREALALREEVIELRAASRRLSGLVGRLADSLARADTSEGVCCCGDSMDRHDNGMSSGHGACDAGDYYAGRLIDEARAELSGVKARKGDNHAGA